MTDALDETESTAEGLSRLSLPVFLRRPRKLAGQESTFCEKAVTEEAREGALADIETGAHDTVIEVRVPVLDGQLHVPTSASPDHRTLATSPRRARHVYRTPQTGRKKCPSSACRK